MITQEYTRGVESVIPAEPLGLYNPVDFSIPVGPIFNYVSGSLDLDFHLASAVAIDSVNDNSDCLCKCHT